jgi:hypothetical protein
MVYLLNNWGNLLKPPSRGRLPPQNTEMILHGVFIVSQTIWPCNLSRLTVLDAGHIQVLEKKALALTRRRGFLLIPGQGAMPCSLAHTAASTRDTAWSLCRMLPT